MAKTMLEMGTTRRGFLGTTALLAASAGLPSSIFGDEVAKPNSVFGGVRVVASRTATAAAQVRQSTRSIVS